jgi:alginate O-acetyltransferase complex protein AlgI
MDFTQILVLIGFGLAYLMLLPAQWRAWALMIGSVIAIYWLQPTLVIRWLDYSLPTATLLLTIGIWYITSAKDSPNPSQDRVAGGITVALILVLTIGRYINLPETLQLTSRPPEVLGVVLAIVLGAGVAWTLQRLTGRWVLSVALLLVIGLLIILQTPPLATALAGFLRNQAGQDVTLASSLDLGWLGFSYVAFRLIHVIRDKQTGILPALTLRQFITYVVFPTAYTAGPIDRAERFLEDLNTLETLKRNDPNRITQAFTRIFIGMFKKFVVADSLALFALSPTNFNEANSPLALWMMLYGYALRLFFDFSGYTDIAIGIGMLFGIQLPENFDRPYLKNNITAFWQAWHMSLTNWVRFYIFSPLSRQLLRREPKPPNELIMFICHFSTMAIIGVWHGVTLPFLVWGLWHGLGLWIHKLWSDRTRKWYMGLKNKPRTKQLWTVVGWVLTFHYVVLGWVWFVMPNMDAALQVMIGLFGVRS